MTPYKQIDYLNSINKTYNFISIERLSTQICLYNNMKENEKLCEILQSAKFKTNTFKTYTGAGKNGI